MTHPNAELIERFYQAFQRLDGEAMAACYAPPRRPSTTRPSANCVGARWAICGAC